jgi:hypothetical protein
MAINLNVKQIILIIFSIYCLFYIKYSALVIPNIYYSKPSAPLDTANCIYNGQTWTNPIGKVWDGYEWK